VSDAWLIAIVGGAAATVVGGLVINPLRQFLVAAWRIGIVGARSVAHVVWRRLAGSVPTWLVLGAVAAWGGITRSLPTRLWGVLAAVAVIALVSWLTSLEVVATAEREPAARPDPAVAKPVAPPVLDGLEDAIIKALARADGAPGSVQAFSDTTGASRLRCQRALERLEGIGLVRVIRSYMDGTSYGLTADGRELAIARGYA
jgi:hypothetical protein